MHTIPSRPQGARPRTAGERNGDPLKKRMVVMLVAVLAFLTAIGTVKFRQIKAGMAMAASFQPPPEAVTTIAAVEAAWPATLPAIGTVEAVRGVTVSADLPGVVEQVAF